MNKGLIQVYTGNGKGKTTAAIGLTVRALGRGLKVAFLQLFKADKTSGEHFFFREIKSNLTYTCFGEGEFIINRLPNEAEKTLAKDNWLNISQIIYGKKHDLIIIDEISHFINLGFIDCNTVLTTLKQKPNEVEVVLTGSNMPEALISMADLVSNVEAVKHPYNEGIKARLGIEY